VARGGCGRSQERGGGGGRFGYEREVSAVGKLAGRTTPGSKSGVGMGENGAPRGLKLAVEGAGRRLVGGGYARGRDRLKDRSLVRVSPFRQKGFLRSNLADKKREFAMSRRTYTGKTTKNSVTYGAKRREGAGREPFVIGPLVFRAGEGDGDSEPLGGVYFRGGDGEVGEEGCWGLWNGNDPR